MKKNLVLFACALLALASCKKNFQNDPATDDNLSLNAGLSAEATAFADTVTLPQIISADRTLSADTLYLLDGPVFVTGGTLTIPAGARIEGLNNMDASSPQSALIITKTGRINARGSQANPIIFTLHLPSVTVGVPELRTRSMGHWEGLAILGDAPTNRPVTEPVARYSPDSIPAGVDVTYGGSNPDHNGGTLAYVRIEYAGWSNLFSSLTCAGVGRKTSIKYVMSSYSSRGAFTFLGGTVSPRFLISNAPGGSYSPFHFAYGYTGNIQFGIAVSGRGITSYNDASYATTPPVTRPQLSNFTCISEATGHKAASFRYKTDLRMRNSIFMNYTYGVDFDHTYSSSSPLQFRNNAVHALVEPIASFTGGTVGPWGEGNLGVINSSIPGDWVNNPTPLTRAQYKSNALVYKPGGSFDPAIAGGVDPYYDGLTTSFLRVPYIGALGPGAPVRDANGRVIIPNNWIAGTAGAWVDFDPK